MRIALHLHHLDQIDKFNSDLVDFVITEPLFSYKHPYHSDKASFLSLLKAALASTRKTYVEINGFIEEGDLSALNSWIQELLTYPITGFLFADLSVLMILKEAGYRGETIYAPETILDQHDGSADFTQKRRSPHDLQRIDLVRNSILVCGFPGSDRGLWGRASSDVSQPQTTLKQLFDPHRAIPEGPQ